MSQWARSKQDWQLTKCSIEQRFRQLLKLSQWTDCAFSVGEENAEIIRCHKLVLAASSPVFEALFFGGLSEPSEIIRVPDVEPFIFRSFLNYIYSDSLDLQSNEEAGGLLYVAKKYIMPHLSESCLCYLINNTSIRTLWEILAIAEALNEEDLLAECLKVMSRFSYEIWSTDSDGHLSKDILSRFLDLRHMHMKEIDVFKFLLHWARKECEYNGLPLHTDSIRSCLLSSGVLSKIRFLAMSPREFTETVVPSGVLSESEHVAFESIINHLPVDEMVVNGVSGFSLDRSPRSSINPIVWQCTREIVTGHRTLFQNRPVEVSITSTARVLVTGFEIATRISSMGVSSHPVQTYRERIVAYVKDQQGNILCKTDHDKYVEFNSFQTVYLSHPVWFEPDVKYVVQCDFPSGQYPLTHYAELALAKGTTFKFEFRLEDRNFCCCFVNSILYSY